MYVLNVQIASHNKDKIGIVIDNNYIDQIEIVNQLNDFCMTGFVIFRDINGRIQNHMDELYTYCEISMNKLKYENNLSNSETSYTSFDEYDKLHHIFFIDKFEILGRDDKEITYKCHLKSINWLSCIKNVVFSNHKQKKELEDDPTKDKPQTKITDIFKDLIVQTGLSIDGSFNKIKSNVGITYITNANDNLCTAQKYLFNKMFYGKDKDEKPIFFRYNHLTDEYGLFDFENGSNDNKQFSYVLNFDDTDTESNAYGSKIQLASVVKTPKSSLYKSLIQQKNTEYSFFDNKFFNIDSNSKSISQYFSYGSSEQFKSRFAELGGISDDTYRKYGSYWGNNINTYNDVFDAVINNNQLIINTLGCLLAQPAHIVDLDIPQNISLVYGTTKEDEDNVMEKYKSMTGAWNISKVRYIIEPTQRAFTQNLCLFRNTQIQCK